MADTPQEAVHRRLVEQVYENVLKPLDSSRVDEFFAPGYIQHNPQAATGAAGLKAFLDWAKNTSPGATHSVKRLFVADDHVICHVHVVINPGDRGLAVIDIFRIEDGRVAEHWDAAQPIPDQSVNPNGMF